MAITNSTTKEALAVYFGTLGAYISLHTGDPSTTGTLEASGGGYARKQTTWTGGTADGIVTGSGVTIDAPAGTWAWAGIWNAASGGTFIEKFAINSTILSSPGQIVVTPTITVT